MSQTYIHYGNIMKYPKWLNTCAPTTPYMFLPRLGNSNVPQRNRGRTDRM